MTIAIGEKVRVNNNYAKSWTEYDGSELHVRGHEGTVIGISDEYVEVQPVNPDKDGWDIPHLFLPEELDKL